jgi:hypothetical protein
LPELDVVAAPDEGTALPSEVVSARVEVPSLLAEVLLLRTAAFVTLALFVLGAVKVIADCVIVALTAVPLELTTTMV